MTKAAPVTVGLIQMRCADDPAANLRTAVGRIGAAAQQGAQIVCLQELFRSPYFCQTEDAALFDLAEPIPGPTTDALGRAAATHGVAVVGSIFERRAAGVYHNTAVLIDADGSLRGLYRKMHIPDDPLYYEKFYFTPGDLGFRSFALRGAQVGALVCWDQWFPEAARLTALSGAQIVFYPTAIGWHPREKAALGAAQREAWEIIQRSHAIANGVFVAVTNRVGTEGNLEFWGGSFVADPFGRILARAGHEREEIVIARCDLGLVDETRRHWPFLRDRRIDAYDGLRQRFLDRTTE
ncbi:MAG TPA: carbon-nitrogen hydrolase [Candidatus Acidoferrales bacterium]|nr:carbon-nitrogen hydrolase [Candidatus Acidoferrales bacterium]